MYAVAECVLGRFLFLFYNLQIPAGYRANDLGCPVSIAPCPAVLYIFGRLLYLPGALQKYSTHRTAKMQRK